MTDPATNLDLSKQLHRVYECMRDGRWRTPSEISVEIGDEPHSIASRLRDLRLPQYGGYNVDVRKRPTSGQVYEYRLSNVDVALSSNNASNTTIIGSIRFLNMNDYSVVMHPRGKCRVDNSQGFDRIVAMDDSGEVLPHLVTTQSDL